MKPFTVASDWIEYAHGPGAESRQPAAIELCDLMGNTRTTIPVDRPDLVEELISVAGLYATDQKGADEEGRAVSRRARQLVKRGREWLSAHKAAVACVKFAKGELDGMTDESRPGHVHLHVVVLSGAERQGSLMGYFKPDVACHIKRQLNVNVSHS